jgi:hypothetical protein
MKSEGSLLCPGEVRGHINSVWKTTAYFSKTHFHISHHPLRCVEHRRKNSRRKQVIHSVIYMTIARQRLGKHVPTNAQPTTEGHPLLSNGPVNTLAAMNMQQYGRRQLLGNGRVFYGVRPEAI